MFFDFLLFILFNLEFVLLYIELTQFLILGCFSLFFLQIGQWYCVSANYIYSNSCYLIPSHAAWTHLSHWSQPTKLSSQSSGDVLRQTQQKLPLVKKTWHSVHNLFLLYGWLLSLHSFHLACSYFVTGFNFFRQLKH